MRKVLHIVEAFGGGIFSFLVDLINSTSDEFEIVIAYGKREQTPIDFKNYFNSNVKFIEVKNFTRNINITKDIKAFFEIKNIIKDINPDVIHLHSSKAGVLGRFATNGKAKVLYNPHGFSFLMKDSSKFKRMLYWLIEKVSSLKNAVIIGCSYGEYKEALKLSKKSIVINNGINIESLKQEIGYLKKHRLDFNNLKICTSGRIGFQKNPKLFNKIANDFPNLQFMWIGDGELRKELTSSNIIVTGWKTRKEVLELVNENDIFILTSLWEGLPISLLEAMFLEEVCLVTDVIGNRDVIKNNNNGYIINENNYKNIIREIDIEKYYEISQKAKKTIEQDLNTKKMCESYKKIYNI